MAIQAVAVKLVQLEGRDPLAGTRQCPVMSFPHGNEKFTGWELNIMHICLLLALNAKYDVRVSDLNLSNSANRHT